MFVRAVRVVGEWSHVSCGGRIGGVRKECGWVHVRKCLLCSLLLGYLVAWSVL